MKEKKKNKCKNRVQKIKITKKIIMINFWTKMRI